MFNGLAKQIGPRQAKSLNEQYVTQATDLNDIFPGALLKAIRNTKALFPEHTIPVCV